MEIIKFTGCHGNNILQPDYFSKLTDTDDWSIDSEPFAYIPPTFGIFTFDIFADNLNKQVARFNSKFYCADTEHVDAFSKDWANEFNWLSPLLT